MSRGHRRVAAAAAACWAAALALGITAATVAGHDPAGDRRGAGDRLAPLRILAPADGNLHVGMATVPQKPGRCSATGSCVYDDDIAPVTVTAPPQVPSLPVSAGRSATFTVSVYSHDRADVSFFAGAAGGRLLLDGLPAGRYRVAVTGDAGGTWQFDLDRTG